jgi:Ser/Thr protein kinase RdoA (MazF antagonist)
MNTFAGMQFPVEYSSLSANALLQFTVSSYGLKKDSDIAFLKRGFNDTYLIRAGESRYVLRVYKHGWRKLPDIEGELEWLLLLRAEGIGVSYPLPDQKGHYIQKMEAPEGRRYAVLFSFAEGKALKKLVPEQAFLLGKASAKLHLATKNLQIATAQNYGVSSQFEHTLEVLEPILVHYPSALRYLQELQQSFVNEFTNVHQYLAKGICHGDLQAENFRITSQNQFIFFDFDFFGKGYLAYDIGVFMWYDHKNKPPRVREAFVKGYETERALSDAEHWAIPWLSTLRAIFQMTVYCKLNNGKHLPWWPPQQVAEFVSKVEKWHREHAVPRAMFKIKKEMP